MAWLSNDMAAMFQLFVTFLFALRAWSLTTNRSHARSADASTFMVVSGITAKQEYCLSVEDGNVSRKDLALDNLLRLRR